MNTYVRVAAIFGVSILSSLCGAVAQEVNRGVQQEVVKTNAIKNGVHVAGKVSDKGNKSKVPFASIALYRDNDTSKAFATAITDKEGRYLIENVPAGKYKIQIDAVGYKRYDETVRIKASQSNKVVKDFAIRAQEQDKGKVIIGETAKAK